ncbi:MAG: hypothetical protein F4081_04630 [Dehalococcoidia bacterium]|nr:hypothetical protein [Dehalococcoidia bacterium]MYI86074.1 hypothetical protein [Dehalococcoidia bacterium]
MPSTASDAQEPEPESVTTLLYPGWNMVGWVGPPTPVARLFEDVPDLTHAYRWDAETRQFKRATPEGAGDGLREVTLGQGLWLHIQGDEPLEWDRTVSDEYALLSLEAGFNLTGWAGRDAEPIESALRRFGDRLSIAWGWDAEAQSYEVYNPAAGASNTLAELNRGDAIWIHLSEDARWWQSGIASANIALPEEATPERREDVRAALVEAIAFFAERYGVQPPAIAFSILSFEGFGGFNFTAFAGLPPEAGLLWSQIYIGGSVTGADLYTVMVHEYFHLLQSSLGGFHYRPMWMTEGSATYAAAIYEVALGAESGDAIRLAWERDAARATTPLSELQEKVAGAEYPLSALAVDWLVAHAARQTHSQTDSAPAEAIPLEEQAGYDSFIEYYRLLPSSESPQEAFAAAFGISLEDFYAAFEPAQADAAFDRELRDLFGISLEEFSGDRDAYRQAALAPLPHTTDDAVRPVVVFLGDVARDVRETVQSKMDSVHTFLTDRLGAEPHEYSVYYGADEASARPTYYGLYHQGRVSPGFRCSSVGGWELFYIHGCQHELSHGSFIHAAFSVLKFGISGSPHPYWLSLAGAQYAEFAYEVWSGAISHEDELARLTRPAHRTTAPLRQIETHQGWQAAGTSEGWALSLLAVDWLVDHAGERSLLEYYRLLPRHSGVAHEPRAGSWEAAFEQAFGLTPDDFYEQFAAYRAELTTP